MDTNTIVWIGFGFAGVIYLLWKIGNELIGIRNESENINRSLREIFNELLSKK